MYLWLMFFIVGFEMAFLWVPVFVFQGHLTFDFDKKRSHFRHLFVESVERQVTGDELSSFPSFPRFALFYSDTSVRQ